MFWVAFCGYLNQKIYPLTLLSLCDIQKSAFPCLTYTLTCLQLLNRAHIIITSFYHTIYSSSTVNFDRQHLTTEFRINVKVQLKINRITRMTRINRIRQYKTRSIERPGFSGILLLIALSCLSWSSCLSSCIMLTYPVDLE